MKNLTDISIMIMIMLGGQGLMKREVIYCKNVNEIEKKYKEIVVPIIAERLDQNYYREPLTHWKMVWIEAVYELMKEGKIPQIIVKK